MNLRPYGIKSNMNKHENVSLGQNFFKISFLLFSLLAKQNPKRINKFEKL